MSKYMTHQALTTPPEVQRTSRAPSVETKGFILANGELRAIRSTGNPAWDRFLGIEPPDDGYNSLLGPEQLVRAYQTSVWVKRCIRVRAQTIASVPLQVLRDNDEPLEDSSPLALQFLNRYRRRMRDIESDKALFGVAFVRPVVAFRGSYDFQRINPLTMMLKRTKEEGVVGFTQYLEGQVYREYEPEELIYLWDYDPGEDFAGLANLSAILTEVGVDMNTWRYMEAFFKNGATPAALITTDEVTLDQDDLKAVADEINRDHKGVENAHRARVVQHGFRVEQLSPPLKDLVIGELNLETARRIAGAFGVPPVLAGITDSANYATAQEQRKSFYSETVKPELTEILDEFNLQFAPLRENNLRLVAQWDEVDVLQEDRTEVTTRATAQFQSGVTGLDESRDLIQLDPVLDDGDDLFLINGQLVWRSQLKAKDLPEPPQQPTQSPFSQLFGASQRSEPVSVPVEVHTHTTNHHQAPPVQEILGHDDAIADLKRWRKKVLNKSTRATFHSDTIHSSIASFIRGTLLSLHNPSDDEVRRVFDGWISAYRQDDEDFPTPEEFEAYWRGADDLLDDIQAAFASLFEHQRATVLKALQDGTPLDSLDLLGGDDLLNTLLGNVDNPGLLTMLFLAGAARGNEIVNEMRADVTIDWQIVNTEAVEWAREHAASTIEGITEVTQKILRDMIGDWIEEGGTLADLASAITDQMEDVPHVWGRFDWATSPERAYQIAQTESTAAFQQGVKQRWQQLGIQQARWRTQNDGIVCQLCRALNNSIGDLDKGWRLTDAMLAKITDFEPEDRYYEPPAHPGCRCFSSPVTRP